jgi:hypothetical protein
MNREREREVLEANEPQPGLDRFYREWNAGNGIAEGLTLRERLLARARAIEAGDRVTAALLRSASDQLGAERAALAEAIVRNMPKPAPSPEGDIVAWLRNFDAEMEEDEENIVDFSRIADAIAEIERLRAELRTYTGDGHTLGEHLAREAT